jgi:dTDP-4-dehydrorhamnose reductase
VVKQLAGGKSPQHPALQSPGWWRRDSRLTIPPPDTFVDLGGMAFPGKVDYQQETGTMQLK